MQIEDRDDRNGDRSDATGSTPPWITLSTNWQQTNETVSKSRCARISLPSPNSRSLCTRLNSLTIYISSIHIYIYTRRWLSLFDPHRYLPPGISHSLQLCQGEYISRAVLRFFQFPPIANRDFELFFESMKRTTLLLPFLLITFLRFETNFVNSFFINIISLDEISLLIFDIVFSLHVLFRFLSSHESFHN